MASPRLRDFVIYLVLFGMMITGYTFFLGDMAVSYGSTIPGNYSQTFQNLRAISENGTSFSNIAEDQVEGDKGWNPLPSGVVILGQGLIDTIKLPFQIIPIYIDAITEMQTLFSIPSWVWGGVTALIFITITFTILAIWRRREGFV